MPLFLSGNTYFVPGKTLYSRRCSKSEEAEQEKIEEQ